jgi:hypothetical protein
LAQSQEGLSLYDALSEEQVDDQIAREASILRRRDDDEEQRLRAELAERGDKPAVNAEALRRRPYQVPKARMKVPPSETMNGAKSLIGRGPWRVLGSMSETFAIGNTLQLTNELLIL